jgi:hypothetical protein
MTPSEAGSALAEKRWPGDVAKMPTNALDQLEHVLRVSFQYSTPKTATARQNALAKWKKRTGNAPKTLINALETMQRARRWSPEQHSRFRVLIAIWLTAHTPPLAPNPYMYSLSIEEQEVATRFYQEMVATYPHVPSWENGDTMGPQKT